MKTNPFRIGRVTSTLVATTFASSLVNLFGASIAEDSFETGGLPDYSTGFNNLVGQGPVVPGFTGNWLAAYPGAQSPDVSATGLTYSDGTNTLTGSGGAIEYFNGGFGRVGRVLTTPITNTSNGTVYFAFLIQLDSVEAAANYRGVELHDGGFDDGGNRRI